MRMFSCDVDVGGGKKCELVIFRVSVD